jgi:hypothetical protein
MKSSIIGWLAHSGIPVLRKASAKSLVWSWFLNLDVFKKYVTEKFGLNSKNFSDDALASSYRSNKA